MSGIEIEMEAAARQLADLFEQDDGGIGDAQLDSLFAAMVILIDDPTEHRLALELCRQHAAAWVVEAVEAGDVPRESRPVAEWQAVGSAVSLVALALGELGRRVIESEAASSRPAG